MRRRRALEGQGGVSIVEVLVSILIFATAILALTTAGVIAGKQLRMSRADVRLWSAVHYRLEALIAQGYDNVAAGSDTVLGYPMSWDVQGTEPKRIILTVQAPTSRGAANPDTFVTYLADWTP